MNPHALALYHHCMAVYNGAEDIATLANYLHVTLGWWSDQIRPWVNLCQAN